MLTKDSIMEALRDVKDPELNKSLVELNMIRNIQVHGTHVALDVILTIQGCPLKIKIQEDVENAIRQLGAEQVQVTFGAMTDEERSALSAKLRAEQQQYTNRGSATTTTQTKATSNASGIPQTNYIAIASGKGGVGKSTVTVNLAVALARAGKKVGIIDADIYGFSVPDMMGIEQRPTVIDEVILPVERYGVKVMSMGFFVEDNAPVVWRGPILGKMLRNFLYEVHWGELDYLLLDLPPGTGDIALDVHQLIPHSKEIIVTTPHATAAFVAARAGAMALSTTKHEILGVVENMAWYIDRNGDKEYVFGRGGGEKLAKELKVELLSQIPLGAPGNVLEEPDYSPSVYNSNHPTGKLYDELAQRVIHST